MTTVCQGWPDSCITSTSEARSSPRRPASKPFSQGFATTRPTTTRCWPRRRRCSMRSISISLPRLMPLTTKTGAAMNQQRDNSTVTDIDRRQLLTSTALGLGAALIAGGAGAQQRTSAVQIQAESFAQTHQPKALPFNSASLNGLSQKLIDSHWQNNYGGSVRALNETK